MTGFEVEWQRDTSVGCSNEDEDTISESGEFTSYTIMGLEPGNRYTITVTVSNSAGTAPVSNTVTAMTLETGEREYLTQRTSDHGVYCTPQLPLVLLMVLGRVLSHPGVSQCSGKRCFVLTVMER